jgi:hypothetical protein
MQNDIVNMDKNVFQYCVLVFQPFPELGKSWAFKIFSFEKA